MKLDLFYQFRERLSIKKNRFWKNVFLNNAFLDGEYNLTDKALQEMIDQMETKVEPDLEKTIDEEIIFGYCNEGTIAALLYIPVDIRHDDVPEVELMIPVLYDDAGKEIKLTDKQYDLLLREIDKRLILWNTKK